jgi:hypothetical protein
MSSNAFDNSGLKDKLHLEGTPVAAFTPSVTFTYGLVGDPAELSIVATAGGTIPSGDTFKKCHLRVVDQFGGEVRDTITATGGGGAKTIDVTTLNISKPLSVLATFITTNGLVADGKADVSGPTGTIAYWDKQ